MRGWIKDWRKELESNIWLMPPLYHRVWQWIKYNVNHEPNKVPFKDGKVVEVGKGEKITSYRQIANGVGYYERGIWREPNVKTIRDILEWLRNEQMIDIESNSQYTRIKVLNWDIYQAPDQDESNSQETVSKQSLDTNKNDKNEKNEKKDLDIVKNGKVNEQEIVSLYHSLCPSLPKVRKLTDARKRYIQARYREFGSIDTFRELFTKAEASDFLTGRNGKWTSCNFDWLIKPSNAVKVLEGTYDNKATGKTRHFDDNYTYTKREPAAKGFFSFLDNDTGGELDA